MHYEIIRVEAHPIDADSLKVTLRERPNLLQRMFGRSECVLTYHGYIGNWYTEHLYQPASPHAIAFLDQIARAPDFRHLRLRAGAKVS